MSKLEKLYFGECVPSWRQELRKFMRDVKKVNPAASITLQVTILLSLKVTMDDTEQATFKSKILRTRAFMFMSQTHRRESHKSLFASRIVCLFICAYWKIYGKKKKNSEFIFANFYQCYANFRQYVAGFGSKY